MHERIHFPSGSTDYHFDAAISALGELTKDRPAVLITDTHIAATHPHLFERNRSIVLEPGERTKTMETVSGLIEKLIGMRTGRESILIGVGGGVVTDLTGFVASIYMRGISFGFVPTSVLAMVDAAIGGKNGVNSGLHKNMIGTIRQPEFLLYDLSLLQSLPVQEWSNGFAEIIKYACIFDAPLFSQLTDHDLEYYRRHEEALSVLIKRCADWKNKTVVDDELEKGERKLLNFGHTIGHAIENLYQIPHGVSVGIGMILACRISSELTGLSRDVSKLLQRLLVTYGLPAYISIVGKDVQKNLHMDKKRTADTIDFIVLEKIGKAAVRNIPFDLIHEILNQFANEGDR